MKDSASNKFARWVAIALILLILGGGMVVSWPTYQRNRSLQARERELVGQIEAKKAEIDKLVECQRRFKTDREFLERLARQNGRVFPGELVFVFDEPE